MNKITDNNPATNEEHAQQIADLKATITQSLESPLIQIQLIKEELQSSSYEIHSDRIAEKLLEFMISAQHIEILSEII
ncbi:MAG: flagellar biosynthesis anti-sigma factor FlgM [Legionellales bacterium]|nr:flagellar biosynthesis anti-sigma factor FlgM [Legionellales bacterium]